VFYSILAIFYCLGLDSTVVCIADKEAVVCLFDTSCLLEILASSADEVERKEESAEEDDT
jgi:hypothetical protein